MNEEFTVKLTPKDDSPAYSQSLPTPINLKEDILVELALLQRYGIITTLPFSKYASPIFAQKKPNGKLRLLVDLRKINNLISDDYINNNHPVSTLSDAAQHMAGKKLYCKLDCSQAYHCLPMADQRSIEMLAFNFASRTFAYRRLAQGLSRVLSAFSSFTREYLDKVIKADQCAQYVDDIGIAANDAEQLIKNLRATFHRLSIQNDIITRQYYDETGNIKYNQILLPKHLVNELLESLHGKANRHPGIAKMLQEIRCKYYYPGIAKLVRKRVNGCETCIKDKRISNELITPELLNLPEWTLGPEDAMQIDLLPNLPPSGGYENIVTAMDVFSRYLFAYPVADASAANTAKVIIDIMTKHTYLPTTLITDKGSAFTSKLVAEIAQILGIQIRCATTKHPQTIGKLERTHASLKTNLKMASGEYRRQLHKYLPLAVLNYNTSYHSTLGCEPSRIFHGRIPHNILDHKLGLNPNPTILPTTDFGEEFQRRTQILLDNTKKNIMQSYLKYKEYYDRKAKASPLKQNDYCFILQPIADHQGSKIPFREFRWIGPYIIEQVLPNENYIVRKLNSNKTQILHRIRLRKYEPNVPLRDERPEGNLQPDEEIIIPQDDLYIITWETNFGDLQANHRNETHNQNNEQNTNNNDDTEAVEQPDQILTDVDLRPTGRSTTDRIGAVVPRIIFGQIEA